MLFGDFLKTPRILTSTLEYEYLSVVWRSNNPLMEKKMREKVPG
jgi:hypothetical protein